MTGHKSTHAGQVEDQKDNQLSVSPDANTLNKHVYGSLTDHFTHYSITSHLANLKGWGLDIYLPAGVLSYPYIPSLFSYTFISKKFSAHCVIAHRGRKKIPWDSNILLKVSKLCQELIFSNLISVPDAV